MRFHGLGSFSIADTNFFVSRRYGPLSLTYIPSLIFSRAVSTVKFSWSASAPDVYMRSALLQLTEVNAHQLLNLFSFPAPVSASSLTLQKEQQESPSPLLGHRYLPKIAYPLYPQG